MPSGTTRKLTVDEIDCQIRTTREDVFYELTQLRDSAIEVSDRTNFTFAVREHSVIRPSLAEVGNERWVNCHLFE